MLNYQRVHDFRVSQAVLPWFPHKFPTDHCPLAPPRCCPGSCFPQYFRRGQIDYLFPKNMDYGQRCFKMFNHFARFYGWCVKSCPICSIEMAMVLMDIAHFQVHILPKFPQITGGTWFFRIERWGFGRYPQLEWCIHGSLGSGWWMSSLQHMFILASKYGAGDSGNSWLLGQSTGWVETNPQ